MQSDEDEEGDGEARLDFRLVKHEGVVNRLRVCPQVRGGLGFSASE